MSGTIRGADGKIVDVMLGFSVLDALRQQDQPRWSPCRIQLDPAVNHCVSASGATKSVKCKRTGYVTGYNWSVLLPANATRLYIEVYPKDPSSSNWLNMPGQRSLRRHHRHQHLRRVVRERPVGHPLAEQRVDRAAQDLRQARRHHRKPHRSHQRLADRPHRCDRRLVDGPEHAADARVLPPAPSSTAPATTASTSCKPASATASSPAVRASPVTR